MRGLIGVGTGVGIGALAVTAACLSSSGSPPTPTGDGGATYDAAVSSLDGGDESDASPDSSTGCVWPQGTGCTFSGAGAATGSGTCNPAVVFKSAEGTAQMSVAGPMSCAPYFFFTAVFTTPDLAPGTYTVASPTVEDTQSGWAQGPTVWREWQRPPPVEGSFTLTITSADATPTDGGIGAAHGSITAAFPITTDLRTDAGTVTAQASF
jgi:hypothetical protein